jgi:hypothetical protein
MKRRAPYQAGDRVRVLHSCAGRGTELATFRLDRVVALNENNRWRIEMTRCDGTGMQAVVNERGLDKHGYVEPVR